MGFGARSAGLQLPAAILSALSVAMARGIGEPLSAMALEPPSPSRASAQGETTTGLLMLRTLLAKQAPPYAPLGHGGKRMPPVGRLLDFTQNGPSWRPKTLGPSPWPGFDT
eukprot:8083635-Pyramimonas_sp.AAC.1